VTRRVGERVEWTARTICRRRVPEGQTRNRYSGDNKLWNNPFEEVDCLECLQKMAENASRKAALTARLAHHAGRRLETVRRSRARKGGAR